MNLIHLGIFPLWKLYQLDKALEEVKLLLIEIGTKRFLPPDLRDNYVKYPSFFETCSKDYLYHSTFSTTTVASQNTTEDININQPDNQEEGQIYKPKIIL